MFVRAHLGWVRLAARLGVIHAVGGAVAALGIAVALANTAPGADTPRVDGPFYDPARLGVWIQERTPGRRTVLFMLGRSRVHERTSAGLRLVEPRPERATPAWATDWSRRIPELHAAGDFVDPAQAMDFGYGWPLVCLHSAQVLGPGARGTLTARDEGVVELAGVRVPTGVSVAGVAASALVLGAPLSGAIGAFRGLRRAIRRRRGVCTVCAYAIDPELRICPECGTAHTPMAGDEPDRFARRAA